MSKFCTKCGKELTDDSLFCSACGSKINSNHVTINNTENTYNKKVVKHPKGTAESFFDYLNENK